MTLACIYIKHSLKMCSPYFGGKAGDFIARVRINWLIAELGALPARQVEKMRNLRAHEKMAH